MNINFTKTCLLLAGLALTSVPNFLNAQAPAADATKPVESETKAALLNVSGQVDAYYRFNSNKVSASKTSYTAQHNAITLGMANVVFAKELGKVGFVADIMFGPRAEETNYAYSGSAAFVKQLYMTYKPTEKLKFTGGNFMTFMGYELVESSNNVNYSMSYNYTNGPFFHTGLKAEYAFSDKFSAMLGVFNLTDTKGFGGLKDPKLDVGNKFLGAQLSYSNGKFKAYLNALTGKDTAAAMNTTLDLVAIYQVTPQFSVAYNVLNKNILIEKTNTSWLGNALYARYDISDKFTLGARGEYLSDSDGLLFGSEKNSIWATTVSGNVKIGALTIIPELRFDSAKEALFSTSKSELSKTETSFILGATFKF
jgi:hypothetical protein